MDGCRRCLSVISHNYIVLPSSIAKDILTSGLENVCVFFAGYGHFSMQVTMYYAC